MCAQQSCTELLASNHTGIRPDDILLNECECVYSADERECERVLYRGATNVSSCDDPLLRVCVQQRRT